MRAPKLVLTAFAVFLYFISFSQPICGFDPIHHNKMQTDSVYRKRVISYEFGLQNYIQQHPELLQKSKGPKVLSGPPYMIPVVVHVVHTGGAVGSTYNPTDAQIQGAIDYLNQVYNGTYAGLSGGVGDLGIQFVLAKRDPNCNSTTGITRTDGSGVSGYVANGVRTDISNPGTDEINVKNLIRWDPTQYYNIWIVNKINGNDGTSGTFIAGYAYFPGGDPNYDGTVMLATQMVAGQKTLPHEIGHAFSLYHPFEGSSDVTQCPTNTSCSTQGDFVCDTDPISYNQSGGVINFSCRTGTNSCTGGAYSINTESNFMNYTNCYTLFTAGQRTRMLASAASSDRVSLSNSLGGTAPDAGSIQCVPKINFEIDNDQVTETSSLSSGCRSYKDYTYNMVIGNNPSAAATATLSVLSGTATEGLDFDITTNGNFSTPSKTITFPTGTDASQSFTIRVYDDASVEGSENFVLGFSVNSNGGNAVAGDGKPNLTITINDNDSAPVGGTTTGTVSIGTATYLYSGTLFDARQQSQRAQFLYKASELTTAGVPAGSISGISLDILNKLSTRSFTNLNIKLGTASVNYLVDTPGVTLGSSMITVKTLASYNTVAGWNDFVFDSPYTWDGTSNLVVEICFDNGSAAAGDASDQPVYYSIGGSPLQGNFFLQNGINCSQSFSAVTYIGSGRKPIIKLSYGIQGTQVQTVLNSSKQEYLGPFSDIYFYDQSNNKLMARIQNASAFDYGCTQVVIDRAGTSATAFWNNNVANYLMDKTFRVLPTNNNPSGSYAITLYYTQNEVSGWQTTTGQNINNIQLVKTTNQISLVTPGNPSGAGVVVTGSPVISTIGSNTGLTYSFSTGFSGFGAGVVGTVLPIGILNFEGQLSNQKIILDWTTSFEANSKQFDIERSYDGLNFTKIGTVAAAGNSSITRNYIFTDTEDPQEKNYYRLKQTDLDNKYQYSKVILITDMVNRSFAVLNNPFNTYVDIQFNETVNGRVQTRLLDVTGRELLRTTNEATGFNKMHLDLSKQNLSAGVYLLEVSYNNEKHVARVIKQ